MYYLETVQLLYYSQCSQNIFVSKQIISSFITQGNSDIYIVAKLKTKNVCKYHKQSMAAEIIFSLLIRVGPVTRY